MLNKKLKTNMERLPTTRKTVGKFALTVLLVFLVASAFCVGTAVATDETKEVHVSPSYKANETHFPTLEDALNATKDVDARIVLDDNITLNKLLIVGALNNSKIVIDGQQHIITLNKTFEKPKDGLHNIIFSLTYRHEPITLKDVVVDFNDNTGDMLIRDAKDREHYNDKMELMNLINVTIANANVTDLTDFGSTLHIAGACVNAQNLQFMFTNQSTGKYEEPNTLAEYMVSYIDLSAGRTVDHGSVLTIDDLPIGAVGKYSTAPGVKDKPVVYNSKGEEVKDNTIDLGFLETKIRFWFGVRWASVKEIATWDDLKNATSKELRYGTILRLTKNIESPNTGAANVTLPIGVIVEAKDKTIKVNAKDSISVKDMMGLRTLLGVDQPVTFGNGTVVIHDDFMNDIILHTSYYLVPGTTILVSEVGTKENVTITLPAGTETILNGPDFPIREGKNVTVVGGDGAKILIMNKLFPKDDPATDDSATMVGGTFGPKTFVVNGVVNLYVPVTYWPDNGVTGSGTINFYVDPKELPVQLEEGVTVNYCPFKLAPGVELYKNGKKVADPQTALCENGSTWVHDGTNLTIPGETSADESSVYTVKAANASAVAQWKIPAKSGVVSKMHMFNAVVEPAATVYVDEHIADEHAGNFYKTIEEALTATKDTEKIIKLESDVTLTKTLQIGGNSKYNITIDGQQHRIFADKKNWTANPTNNLIIIYLTNLPDEKAITLKDVVIDFGWTPGDMYINNGGDTHSKVYLTNVSIDGINFLNLTKLRSGIHIDGGDVVVKNLKFDKSYVPLEHWAKTIDLEATSCAKHGSTLTIDNLPYVAYGKYAFDWKKPTVINSTSDVKVEPITFETFLSVYSVDIWLPFGTSKVYDVGTWKEFVDATKKVEAGDVICLTKNISSETQTGSVSLPEGVIVNSSAHGGNHTITLNSGDFIIVHDIFGLSSLLGYENPVVCGNGTIRTAWDFKNLRFYDDSLYIPIGTTFQIEPISSKKQMTNVTITLPSYGLIRSMINESVADDADFLAENGIHIFDTTLVVPALNGSEIKANKHFIITSEEKPEIQVGSSPSVRIVSVENQTSPFTVNGVVSFKVPVEEWPTTGVSGNGKINIYEKSVLPSKTGNVKFYFTPIKEAHHGTILEHVYQGADQGLDTLYANGTKWELSKDGKTLYIGDKNWYSLSPEPGYVGDWNLTGTSGVITNARMIQPVFVKEEKTSSSSSYSSKSKGGSILLSTGASSVASTASSTATSTATTESTAAVTAVPTTVPTTAPTTVAPTATKTAKPTQTAASPLPFAGILAGLGAAAVLFGVRRQ